jgi:hypothetical protein
MNFTPRGRSRRAQALAERLLNRLFDTANRMELNPPEGWLSDYALGFIWRHLGWAQEMAGQEYWCGLLPSPRPSDSEQRGLFVALVSPRITAPRDAVESAYDAAVATVSEGFALGVAEADRILHRVDGGDIQADPAAGRVDQIEREFRRLPGRHPLSRFVGLALSSKLYPYLVLRTLAPAAFQITPSDADMSRLLGFGEHNKAA